MKVILTNYSCNTIFTKIPLQLTSLPVGTCLASLTFAKFPLPIVLINRYLPI